MAKYRLKAPGVHRALAVGEGEDAFEVGTRESVELTADQFAKAKVDAESLGYEVVEDDSDASGKHEAAAPVSAAANKPTNGSNAEGGK